MTICWWYILTARTDYTLTYDTFWQYLLNILIGTYCLQLLYYYCQAQQASTKLKLSFVLFSFSPATSNTSFWYVKRHERYEIGMNFSHFDMKSIMAAVLTVQNNNILTILTANLTLLTHWSTHRCIYWLHTNCINVLHIMTISSDCTYFAFCTYRAWNSPFIFYKYTYWVYFLYLYLYKYSFLYLKTNIPMHHLRNKITLIFPF